MPGGGTPTFAEINSLANTVITSAFDRSAFFGKYRHKSMPNEWAKNMNEIDEADYPAVMKALQERTAQ